MELVLTRQYFTPESTVGTLTVDGAFECYTLEDAVQPEKIAGRSCIAPGRYRVQITWSPRFKQRMPLLLDVPEFSGVRIHPGNTAEDTEGCILVGRKRFTNRLGESRLAYTQLFKKLDLAAEDVWLEIVNQPVASIR